MNGLNDEDQSMHNKRSLRVTKVGMVVGALVTLVTGFGAAWWQIDSGRSASANINHSPDHVVPPIRSQTELELASVWQDVRTQEEVQIERKGDEIFQKGNNHYSNGGIPFERSFDCQTSRSGSQWTGSCTYLYKVDDGRQCWVKTEEVITSVDQNHIEGKSQDIAPSKNGRGCPTPSAAWTKYSLRPKR